MRFKMLQIMQNNPVVVMAAVLQNGDVFKYASDALKADQKFVLNLLFRKSDALEHASDALKNDPEVVLAAVTQGWIASICFRSTQE